MTWTRTLGPLLLAPLLLGVSGCDMVLLNPAGDVARQQRDVLIASTGLMLVIIVPVMALTVFFAFRYRQSNRAKYRPNWQHSTGLEVAIWSAPLAIIVALGAITWVSTHLLDPYRTLARIAPDRPVNASARPLRVEVVALDWKWLFIYPDLGIASLNELAAPVDTPITLQITASHVMNAFFAPALAGQIYAMPGMETPLHAVMNKTGDFEGFSANYSGAGFSDMRFRFRSLSPEAFQRWTAGARTGGATLDRDAYLKLDRPSEREPVRYFSAVAPGLYAAVLDQCLDPARPCGAMAGSAAPAPGKD